MIKNWNWETLSMERPEYMEIYNIISNNVTITDIKVSATTEGNNALLIFNYNENAIVVNKNVSGLFVTKGSYRNGLLMIDKLKDVLVIQDLDDYLKESKVDITEKDIPESFVYRFLGRLLFSEGVLTQAHSYSLQQTIKEGKIRSDLDLLTYIYSGTLKTNPKIWNKQIQRIQETLEDEISVKESSDILPEKTTTRKRAVKKKSEEDSKVLLPIDEKDSSQEEENQEVLQAYDPENNLDNPEEVHSIHKEEVDEDKEVSKNMEEVLDIQSNSSSQEGEVIKDKEVLPVDNFHETLSLFTTVEDVQQEESKQNFNEEVKEVPQAETNEQNADIDEDTQEVFKVENEESLDVSRAEEEQVSEEKVVENVSYQLSNTEQQVGSGESKILDLTMLLTINPFIEVEDHIDIEGDKYILVSIVNDAGTSYGVLNKISESEDPIQEKVNSFTDQFYPGRTVLTQNQVGEALYVEYTTGEVACINL